MLTVALNKYGVTAIFVDLKFEVYSGDNALEVYEIASESNLVSQYLEWGTEGLFALKHYLVTIGSR